MKFVYACLVFAACFAACYSRDIYVNTTTQFQNAIKNILPGDTIIVAAGKYQIAPQAYSTVDIIARGTSDKPITLTCEVTGFCEFDDSFVIGGSSYFKMCGIILGFYYKFNALTVQDSDHVTLSYLTIRHGENNNLWLLRSTDCTVDHCSFGDSDKGLHIEDGSDNTVVNHCTFGDGFDKVAVYIRNSTKATFSDNVINGRSKLSSGSWIIEYDAGGNLISDNEFGFSFAKYQLSLNGYLAKGSCLYGPTTLKKNYMDLKKGVGFAGCKDYKNRVCASNVIDGAATLTDGDIDQSC